MTIVDEDRITKVARRADAITNVPAPRVATEPPTVFFDESGLQVPKLADAVAKGTRLQLGIDGRIYRYSDGVYRSDGEAFVRSRTKEILGKKFRRRHTDEVLAYFRSAFPTIGEHPPAGLLNLRNGLLNLRTLSLQPHSPDVLSTIQLPVIWDPDATCPMIDRFLSEVVPPDAVDLIYEVIGYATYPANPFRVAVLLLGPGRNGKSVLLRLLTAFLGMRNVSSMPLQVLAENRFAPAELLGKLANICGDLDAREVRRSDQFKIITGGDMMNAERKYGHPFQFTPYSLLAFSANEAPISSDQTEAWFDRWIIVPMEHRFSEKEADAFLFSKLATPAELSGLLVLAVRALQRLMIRGRFERPSSIEAAGDAYRDKLDTCRGFVGEMCRFNPDGWASKPGLYAAYRDWCRDSGRLAVSAVRFNEHMMANYAAQVGKTTRHGTDGWAGIEIVTNRVDPSWSSRGGKGGEGGSFSSSPTRARDKEGGNTPPLPPSPPNGVEADVFTWLDPDLEEGF
jgi:putative DNA primase/helicase